MGDGSSEAQQRFGKEFEIVSKATFGVGDRVKGKDSGKVGTVTAVDADGDPKVLIDGESDAKQRFGKEFEIFVKGGFSVGDRVRGKDSGKVGTVVSVDVDGDPKVKLDDEPEAKQRFAKEFDVIKKADKNESKKRSRSGSNKKKKKKKKKQEKESVFGKSTLELMAEARKAKAKHEKKYGKNRNVGAEAALAFMR